MEFEFGTPNNFIEFLKFGKNIFDCPFFSKSMKYNSEKEIVEACYSYLESHLVEGTRWGMKYRFYKPANTKYGPHQWLWDSGWHMIVWSHRKPENAIEDLRTMLQFQQPNGFIPEMIFWGGKLFLERIASIFFGYSNDRYTDISQMPMLAFSLRAIWDATKDVELMKEFVPKMVKYFDWWANERDPDHDGLVSIIHPWESGIDASPVYDPAHYVKNPTYKQLYPRFLKLLYWYKRKYKWDQQKILASGRFNVEDVGLNAVYASGWGILADLANKFDGELSKYCKNQQQRFESAILTKCWSPKDNMFVTYFHQDGKEKISTIETIQSLFPILLDSIPKDLQSKIIEKIKDPERFWLPYPIPSTAKREETFNPHQNRLLWRGPTWPCTTWLVMEGLIKHGYTDLASEILDRWIQMYKEHGIYEYHNPINGVAEGEEGLGMSTTIVDMLKRLRPD